jgi:uncharacterized protein
MSLQNDHDSRRDRLEAAIAEDCLDTAASTASDPPDFECIDAEQVWPEEREKALAEGNRPLALLVYALGASTSASCSCRARWSPGSHPGDVSLPELPHVRHHRYAVIVAALSVQIIKRLGLRTAHGEHIRLSPKEWGDSRIPGARYLLGGTVFGMGWALIGACPGPSSR